MKKLAFFSFIMALSTSFSTIMAQSEIGLRFQPSPFALNNAELVWKKQINEHKWHRLSVGDFEAKIFPKSDPNQADIDVSYGRERRWFIVEHGNKGKQFALITGKELTVGSRYTGDSRSNFPKRNWQNSSAYIGANAVLGMQYAFSRRFAVNAEITPGIEAESVPYLAANDLPARKMQFNVDIWNPRVSLVYRIGNK